MLKAVVLLTPVLYPISSLTHIVETKMPLVKVAGTVVPAFTGVVTHPPSPR
jgi:hypothetical protein